LTEEEKKARLAELRERVKAKRALSAVEDKEAAKRNEVRYLDTDPSLTCI
jgi:UBX domain-containing protein 1/4